MSGRPPCGWFENGRECGKPSVDHMGDWYLCAEHHDELIREAESIGEDDDEVQEGD